MSSSADEEQEGYRSYLLRRLLPAMAAFYSAPTGNMLDASGNAMKRLAARTTAELEGRVADLYDRLLMVRTAAPVLGASILGHESSYMYANRAHGKALF